MRCVAVLSLIQSGGGTGPMKPGNPRRLGGRSRRCQLLRDALPKDKGKAGVGWMRPLPLKRPFLMGKALATGRKSKRKWVASCENNVVFPRPPVECAYPPLSRRAFWAESLHAGGKRCFDRDPPRLRHVLPREPGVKGERVGRRSLRAAGHRRQVGV